MQTHIISLSDKIPSSKDKIISFNSYLNEHDFIITCNQKFDMPLVLILKNASGQTDSTPFYENELGIKYKKKPHHTFLILEKGNNPLPNPLIITIKII